METPNKHVHGSPRLAVISGGASGIGRALVHEFLSQDYNCLVLDKDQAALDSLQSSLPEPESAKLALVCLDLLKDPLSPVVAALRDCDAQSFHLINNVGGSLTPKRTFESLQWRDIEASLEFNLRPTIELTQALLPSMRARRAGWIVNVSSIAARAALDYVGTDYAAAKASVVAATRTLAKEVSDAGVLVNAVCPGITATPRIVERWSARSDARNREMLASIPLARLAEPAEVARACFFLGSASNTYITGAVLDVNGGAFLA